MVGLLPTTRVQPPTSFTHTPFCEVVFLQSRQTYNRQGLNLQPRPVP